MKFNYRKEKNMFEENNNIPAMTLNISSPANLQLADPDLLNYYKDIEKRIYYLEGEISDGSMDLVKYIMRCNMEDLEIPTNQRKPIIVVIDSPGGSVDIMRAIIGAINISKTPVATVNICNSYSAAACILASGHKGLRMALPKTSVMFHSGYSAFQGTNTQVDNVKKFYDKIDKDTTEDLYSRTKFSSKIKNKMKNEDIYLTETEALENGVIDKIIESFDELLAIGGDSIG